MVKERYSGWEEKNAKAISAGETTLNQITEWVEARNINPTPRSGCQELLENIVNRYV